MINNRHRLVQRLTKILGEVLFPTRCLACKVLFHSKGIPPGAIKAAEDLFSMSSNDLFVHQMTPFLCSRCRARFFPVESPICSGCGMMFESRTGGDHYCGECIVSPKKFKRARAFGLYDHALMSVIHGLKYNAKVRLARPLGIILFSAFIRFWPPHEIDCIVPVPLYIRKHRRRGFNQSFLLVKDWPKWSDQLSEPISITTEHTVLVRNRWTEPQTALSRKDRLANIKGAFTVPDTFKVKHKNILLIDDVYTTGATVNECSTALLRAGANYVDVLTLARATSNRT